MDGVAAGPVDGSELVVVWGAGFAGGCFPKASSTSIGKRKCAPRVDHLRSLVLQTLDFRTIEVINVRIVVHADGALFLSLASG